MKHFLTVEDMSANEIISLLDMTAYFRQNEPKISEQLFIANLFFEPSTRTKMSFTVAEKKLGLEILDFHAETSSVKKGESLYDTVKTFEAIGANALVIRHEDDYWAEELANVSIPIINAGAGKAAHPTQSLLDAYTIYEEFGYFEGLNIVIAGDIKHSRVAHSNIEMLTTLGANVFVTGAPEFIDETINVPYISFEQAIKHCDVLMLLRIQHERHNESFDISAYHKQYGLTIQREKSMKQNAIILHPAPINRGVEIDSSLVECGRSRIFKQMENGVFVRMAVLVNQLLQWGIINDYKIKKCANTKGEQPIRKVRTVN